VLSAAIQSIMQVHAWRCRGKLPLSLDVTAQLVEAQLLDEAGGASTSQAMLCGAYALPLTRLVNGVADAQQRGKVAASVAQLAAAAGLPSLLVDVRHSTTHGDLPALPLLRLATTQALVWLRGAYW
jgi:ribosomal biogenesis protein LAS1